MENNKKNQISKKELLESIMKNPRATERGEIIIDDESIFDDDYESLEIMQEMLKKHMKC